MVDVPGGACQADGFVLVIKQQDAGFEIVLAFPDVATSLAVMGVSEPVSRAKARCVTSQ